MKTRWMGMLALMSFPAMCEPLNLAVAANFTAPMQIIIQDYQDKTGEQVRMSVGASGKFVAQIRHGAPFDIFFSADQAKPQALMKAGLAEPGSMRTYAVGSLALWSVNPEADVRQQLEKGHFRKLALANPKLAPYGSAAVAVLENLGLHEITQSKWVRGENIAQTFQFVQSGNADLGFVALSQLLTEKDTADTNLWIVPAALHPPIRQDRVVMKKSAQKSAVKRFLAHFQGAESQAVILSYGYALPVDGTDGL
ncbi:molybdate ABC transporter substrate-binding protein [Bowmanella pacifica]|uniref:Molybdate-binding periplasmic protein ModA n=1 Tax=Bowmanella pacifica TaxID=502051 RepID=A0A918DKT9_9ALTE|nr:molybdate ABC transporter substrate-binding protein [Bowmanella pacifica]GGO69623.1 molybdate-binding periplasmic protein ModA [Bowmanella pacifica]